MSSSERTNNVEYESETELVQDYQKTMSNPANVSYATQYLYDQLVDDVILQIVFRSHFESKHPEIYNSDSQDDKKGSSHSEYNSGSSGNKLFNCKCLNCEKVVSANKFASHLENCMGFGRNSSRIASRKKTTNNSYYDSESDTDTNWNERKTKKKLGNGRSNGKNNKKNYNM
ncbi:hypothetical protein ACKWTF_015077 [Chironomus riparius]